MTLEEAKAKIADLENSVAALEAKRDEVLGEAKALKTKLKAAEDRAKELEGEAEELRADLAKKATGADELRASLEKKYGREKADLEAKIAQKDGQIHKLVVANALKAELTAAGVAPHFIAAAEALLAPKASVEDGEVPKALIDGKPLAEFVKSWAGADGKHFISLQNSGGGAPGGGDGGGKSNPYARDTLNFTEQARLEREAPGEAKRLRDLAGARSA